MNEMNHIQGALKTPCAWIGRYEERGVGGESRQEGIARGLRAMADPVHAVRGRSAATWRINQDERQK